MYQASRPAHPGAAASTKPGLMTSLDGPVSSRPAGSRPAVQFSQSDPVPGRTRWAGTDDQIGELTLRPTICVLSTKTATAPTSRCCPGRAAADLAGGLAAIGPQLASGFNLLSEELGLMTALRGLTW
jgi:hypothetical protein